MKNPRLKKDPWIELEDPRQKWVKVPCGKCLECRKAKGSAWRIRLLEENKTPDQIGIFITLTFNEHELNKMHVEAAHRGHWEDPDTGAAILAVRRFTDNWRKEEGYSLKRFMVTEKGHKNTKRIHLHGVIWINKKHKYEIENKIRKKWKYGFVWVDRKAAGDAAMTYISKYITKIDTDNPNFIPTILVSPGLGQNLVTKEIDTRRNMGFKEGRTYHLKNGTTVSLPDYYVKKIWNENERAQAWSESMNEGRVWVNGHEIIINTLEKTELACIANEQSRRTEKNKPFKNYESVDFLLSMIQSNNGTVLDYMEILLEEHHDANTWVLHKSTHTREANFKWDETIYA